MSVSELDEQTVETRGLSNIGFFGRERIGCWLYVTGKYYVM